MTINNAYCANIKITTQCNKNCEFCYETNNDAEDLSFETMSSLLDDLCEAGFKEIRISGGEPLLRKDLNQIIKKAKKLAFKVLLSTNGDLLGLDKLEQLQHHGLDELYISIGHTIDPTVIQDLGVLVESFQKKHKKLKIGLNLIVGKSFLKNDVDNFKLLIRNHIKLVYLIPPKRCPSTTWLENEKLDFNDYFLIYKLINYFRDYIEIIPDCGFYWVKTFSTYRNGTSQKCYHTQKPGIVIKNDGSIAPCTYFTDSEYCFGNVREKPLKEILREANQSAILEKILHENEITNKFWENPCLRY